MCMMLVRRYVRGVYGKEGFVYLVFFGADSGAFWLFGGEGPDGKGEGY